MCMKILSSYIGKVFDEQATHLICLICEETLKYFVYKKFKFHGILCSVVVHLQVHQIKWKRVK